MRIISLSYENIQTGWKLTGFDLSSPPTQRLALLVGLSGVGKTQILRALQYLRTFSKKEPRVPINWTVTFENDGSVFQWEGRMEGGGDPFMDLPLGMPEDLQKEVYAGVSKPSFIYEKLTQVREEGDIEICFREKGQVRVGGIQNPVKFSESQSLLQILKHQEPVEGIVRSINLCSFYYDNFFSSPFVSEHFDVIEASLSENKNPKRSIEPEDPIEKLHYYSEFNPTLFSQITEDFYAIFPHVDYIIFQRVSQPPRLVIPFIGLFLKEKGIEKPIGPNHWSQGMLKTLVALIEAHSSKHGTLILVDEFENSLGVNCIDRVVEAVLHPANDSQVQFILTSHHPYIIGNIPFAHWRLVVRDGNVVSCLTPEEAGVDTSSRHTAYLSLINSRHYSN